jgi:hypothetical protein
VASTVRPNNIWLGNPIFHHWQATTWTNFTIDRIAVDAPEQDDPQDFQFQPGGGLSHSSFSLDHDNDPTLPDEKILKDIPPASAYNIQEVLPTGWDLITNSCDHGNTKDSISISSGELVTCSFTNQKRGRVIVTKDAQPNNSQDFDFRVRERTPRFIEDFEGTSVNDLSDLWNTSTATTGKRWCSTSTTGTGPLTAAGNWVDAPTTQCHNFGPLTPPYGSVAVSNGKATVSGGSARAASYFWTGPPSRNSPFPATGDFILDVRMKFDSLAGTFTHLYVRDWPNSDPSGNNPPGAGNRVFDITAATSGLFVGLLGGDAGGPLVGVPSPTAEHNYRLEYVGGSYSLYIDGALFLGPVASSVRPNSIWVGQPVFLHTASDYSDFNLSRVHVRDLNATNFQLDDDGDSDATLDETSNLYLYPGHEYSLDETVPSGWSLASATCDRGESPDSIGLTSGETVHCNFTNQGRGTVVIKKRTVHPDQSTAFTFTPANGLPAGNFTLDDWATSTTIPDTKTYTNVVAQNGYTVTEAGNIDFIVGVSCDDGSSATPSTGDDLQRRATINVDPGETVTCTFLNTGIYPRPQGASPLRVPLVPSFVSCTASNSTHVTPFDKPSCTPPQQESSQLTTGLGNQNAFANFTVYCNGTPTVETPPCSGTPGDQVDVRLVLMTSDVRKRSDGNDYVGKVILQSDVRMTDRSNDVGAGGSGTAVDTPFSIPVDCLANAGANGSNCNLTTTLDTIVPNFARELKRSVISLGAVRLLDAGPNGTISPPSPDPYELGCPPICGDGDEQAYLRQGVYAP